MKNSLAHVNTKKRSTQIFRPVSIKLEPDIDNQNKQIAKETDPDPTGTTPYDLANGVRLYWPRIHR
mgnify:CR=1 FL=1